MIPGISEMPGYLLFSLKSHFQKKVLIYFNLIRRIVGLIKQVYSSNNH